MSLECSKKLEKFCIETFKITKAPTIRIYLEDKSKPFVENRKISMANLEREVISRLESHIVKVGKSSLASIRETAIRESKQVFIVYPTKKSTSPLFMSLSTVRLAHPALQRQDPPLGRRPGR